MITFFTTAKPFLGNIKTMQVNALRSWTLLQPKCEVILFGSEEGSREVAAELGIRHVSEVERNEYGTPLVRSLFRQAEAISTNKFLCYLNADVILVNDFIKAVSRIKMTSFLLVGQRYDIELTESLDYRNAQWEAELMKSVREKGSLHGISGMDYFVFPGGQYRDIPALAIGRPGWDNWLIYRTRSQHVPVIDITPVVTVVHQNHGHRDYPGGEKGFWEGPEAAQNLNLMQGLDHSFSLDYATGLMTPRGLRRILNPKHIYFTLRAIPVLYPRLRFLLPVFKTFEKFYLRNKNSSKH